MFCWKPWHLPWSSVGLAFSDRSEQLDAIYAVVKGKDAFVKAATGFWKSVEAFSNPSFSSIVISMEDKLQEIVKDRKRGKKLHEELMEVE